MKFLSKREAAESVTNIQALDECVRRSVTVNERTIRSRTERSALSSEGQGNLFDLS